MAAGAVMTLAFAAVESAQAAAPAPVPCTSSGGGHYTCDWYVTGDGKTGGAIVAVGTTTVGYLHKGSNWIVCQQQGGEVHNAAGDANHWFAWTQADDNAWGWASALDASGGDNYGPFGGGTPSCNGAHGSPPSYSGLWGSPPAGSPPAPPPPVDADRDGYSPPADCDDTDSHVHPGAVEVPGDGIDQDCNGSDAAGRLAAVVSNSWVASRTSTRVVRLRVTDAPAGASVSVACRGHGCPKPRTVGVDGTGRATLTKLFRHRLRPGARVDVTVTAPNTVGKVVRFTIRRSHTPKTRTLCLPPGGKPGTC